MLLWKREKCNLAICMLNWNFWWTEYTFELKLKEIEPTQEEECIVCLMAEAIKSYYIALA